MSSTPVGPGWARRSISPLATGTTALTITAPAGIVDDDLLFLAFTHKGSGFGVVPGGFSLVERALSGATRGELYWKRAASESGAYSVTGLATTASGVVIAYSGGLAAGQVIEASSARANASGATGTLSILPTTPHALVLMVGCLGSNNSVTLTGNQGGLTDDPDLLFLSEQVDGGHAGGSRIVVADAIKIVPGPTGDMKQSFAVAVENVGILAVVTPEPSPGTGTTYYLTTKRPPVRVEGPLAGGWRSTVDSMTAWGQQRVELLSQRKGAAGTLDDRDFKTNQQGNYDVLIGRWMSPPLAGQTLAGTIDLAWVIATWWADFTLGHQDLSVVRTKLHVYVTKGQTAQVRGTALSRHLEAVDWPFDTAAVRKLASPAALTSTVIEPGDSIMVELGFRLVSSPTPAPHYPPDEWTGTIIAAVGATNQDRALTHSGVPYLDAALGVSGITQVPFLQFSQALIEADPPTTPANVTEATAKVIAAVPYQEDAYDVTTVPNAAREVWYSWTADADGLMFANVYGSNHVAQVRVLTGTIGSLFLVTVVAQSQTTISVDRAQHGLWFDAVKDTTYFIRVRTVQERGGTAHSSGGALRLCLIRSRAPKENDLYVVSRHIIAMDPCGTIVNAQTGFESSEPAGVDIDYSKAAMDDNNNPGTPHVAERLYLGLHDFPLVEVLDLATLNVRESEIDFIGDVWDNASGKLMAHPSNVVLPRVGTKLLVGWFGDGYQHVSGARVLPTTLNNVSEDAESSAVRRTVRTNGDSQSSAPFALAENWQAPFEITAPHQIALDPDGKTLYYTSGGWYVPNSQIAGVTKDLRAVLVKRWDLDSGTALEDFATVVLVPGDNPGLRGLAVLPSQKGILVCNGSQVQWIDANGVTIRSYVPAPAEKGQSLSGVAIESNSRWFWAFDADSTTLFRFHLASGAQGRCIETHQAPRVGTQMAIYTPNGLDEICW